MGTAGGKSGAGKRQRPKRSERSWKDSLSANKNTGPETSLEEGTSKPGQSDPGLYIVATPIGNARDITLRALDTLRAADVIVCEDTRVTAKLLAIYAIRKPLMAYHEHNADKAGPEVIRRLKQGETVALVSDAGTPLVSDPGYRLVKTCAEEGLFVTHLPGPSSVLTALVLAGLPTDSFLFGGFPPPKSGKRVSFFEEMRGIPATLVFLESPKRLAKSLADMVRVFGDRPAAMGRELTKKFEEIRRGALPELAEHFSNAGAPKGEVVLIVGPPDTGVEGADEEDIDALLLRALKSESLKDAVIAVTAATGAPKKQIYARALKLSAGET